MRGRFLSSSAKSFVELWNPAAHNVLSSRDDWYASAAKDDNFISKGGKVYPYDIIHANSDPLCRLMAESGFENEVALGSKIVDVGCANGDLSYALSLAGFDVTALDWSFAHDQAPAFVSAVAKQNNLDMSVVDISVDRYFGIDDIRSSAVHRQERIPDIYELAISFGLVYHLKNPFAFFESISKIAKRFLVGTHVVTHLPQLGARIDGSPVAYLVDTLELNSDPTNYWMMTPKAFERIALRCGFQIEARIAIPNNPLGVSTPDDPSLGVRHFLALRSTAV